MTTYPKIKGMSPLLLVADLNHSLEFYTQKLGFKIAFYYEDFYAGISKDGYTIHLKTGKSTAEERESRRKNEDLDIIFSIEEIEEQYGNIKKQSMTIIQPLREMPYGKEFYIADADDHILGFVEEK